MSPDQAAPYGIVALFVIKEAYTFFTAGQKFDDRVKKHIADAALADKTADELRKEMAQKDFDHMAGDIKRISDAMSEIMRMLRESVATKQDILQLDARMDALEESNRAHYDAFRRVDREISSVRERCGSHHRKPSDSSAFPMERAR